MGLKTWDKEEILQGESNEMTVEDRNPEHRHLKEAKNVFKETKRVAREEENQEKVLPPRTNGAGFL